MSDHYSNTTFLFVGMAKLPLLLKMLRVSISCPTINYIKLSAAQRPEHTVSVRSCM